MDSTFFVDLKRRIGFDSRDAENIHRLWSAVAPSTQDLANRFQQWLLSDLEVRAVLAGGAPQIDTLRRAFVAWLTDVFTGAYDFEYFDRRIDIGRTHVQLGLSQHNMFIAMETIWRDLQGVVRSTGLPNAEEMLASLHRLLTLDMAVMLESFKKYYSQKVRDEERSVAAEQLTRSEHLAQLGQLAASLAHEIKNPLAGISGAIQVLRDQMDSGDPRQSVIREILGQIDRLDATVKDLLVYARPRQPQFQPCDMVTSMHRALKMIRQAEAMRPVPVTVHAEPNVPPVPVDVRQIEQLIMNLLFNAAHACKAGGSIDAKISSADRKVVLEIVDTGSGMSPEVLAKAFEPFFTTKSKGTGLGLPICKRIVEAHGGSIEMQSQPGQGTRVTVKLPQVWS